jgi:hypothetical protein
MYNVHSFYYYYFLLLLTIELESTVICSLFYFCMHVRESCPVAQHPALLRGKPRKVVIIREIQFLL